MKQILLRCSIFLLMFAPTGKLQAQAHLQIDALIGFPDSAYTGATYSTYAIVRNTGTTPYQGSIQILFQADSQTVGYYYNSNQAILLLPQDTAVLAPPNGFTFSASKFHSGGNVVVVWPYTSTSVSVSYLTTSVYILGALTGIETPAAELNLQAWPNPTRAELYLSARGRQLESVRIFSLEGRLVSAQSLPAGEETPAIDLQTLPVGMYVIEVMDAGGMRSMVKVLKIAY